MSQSVILAILAMVMALLSAGCFYAGYTQAEGIMQIVAYLIGVICLVMTPVCVIASVKGREQYS